MSLINDILAIDEAIGTGERQLREIGEALAANKRKRAALVAILTPDEIAKLNPVIPSSESIGETPTPAAAPVSLEV
jgi:hypothetical protein